MISQTSLQQLQKSPTYQFSRPCLFKRNRTLDGAPEMTKLSSRCILQDKESLYDQLQQLKVQNHSLRQTLKQMQAQQLYLRRELFVVSKEDESPSKDYARIRQGYMEKIERMEEEMKRMQSELYDAQHYVTQLQTQGRGSNMETMCVQLSEDNIKLTSIIQTQEDELRKLQLQCARLETKFNAISWKYQQTRKLNSQLLVEVGELKRRDTLFVQRPPQQSSARADEQLQLELDQTQINLRNAEKRVQTLENKLSKMQGELSDKIETLEKKVIELKKENQLQLKMFEDEKAQFQQRFHKRTILKSIVQSQEDSEQLEQDVKTKKSINVEKADVSDIARQVKMNLISAGVSLADAEKYLLTSETLSIQQLIDNLHHQVFGIDDFKDITLLAQYLADVEQDNETTTSTRVRSIFKTLMENYVILQREELLEVNKRLGRQRTEIQDYIMKKWPDVYCSGSMQLAQYMDVLDHLEITLSKHEAEHLRAQMLHSHGSYVIQMQQLFEPFSFDEARLSSQLRSHDLPPINVLMADVDDLGEGEGEAEAQGQEGEQNSGSEEGIQMFDDHRREHEPSGNPMSEGEDSQLEIKMVNSQELKKRSQTELQQV